MHIGTLAGSFLLGPIAFVLFGVFAFVGSIESDICDASRDILAGGPNRLGDTLPCPDAEPLMSILNGDDGLVTLATQYTLDSNANLQSAQAAAARCWRGEDHQWRPPPNIIADRDSAACRCQRGRSASIRVALGLLRVL